MASIALGSERGERADVPRKLYVTGVTIRRSRAMAYYRQRLDGRTDAEIGDYFGHRRETINRAINGLSEEAKDQVRRERLRSIRADRLFREMEMADAV